MIFGTFDGIHKGHRFVFKEAKKQGDTLLVVVALDKTVRVVKGRNTLHNERWRLREVLQEENVDDVVFGHKEDMYRAIKTHRPDVICLGYDQKNFTGGLREKLNDLGLYMTRIVRLEAYEPEKYKSSRINKWT